MRFNYGIPLFVCVMIFSALVEGQELGTANVPDPQASLLKAFKNARSSKSVRLVTNSKVNDVMEEDAVIEFVKPNRFYQQITKRRTDQTLHSERIQIGNQTFEKVAGKWQIERGPVISVKDSFESALAPVLVNSEAAWPKLNSLKVELFGTENVNGRLARVFSYELDNNWLRYFGKVWVVDDLPIKAEMWTPKDSRNKIFSSTLYDYQVAVRVENPIVKSRSANQKKNGITAR